MNELIGYKVVRLDEFGNYVSAMLRRGFSYRLNETTIPPHNCGPMAIFDRLDAARHFVDVEKIVSPVILKVNYIPSSESCLRIPDPTDEEVFFYYRRDGFALRPLYACPDGTVLADSVTPLEIVE